MGLFRPSRTRRGPDPYYDWKVVLFTVGAAVGLIGMFTSHDGLILLAVPILTAGVVLRWLPHQGAPAAEREEAEAAEEEPADAGPARDQGMEPDEAPDGGNNGAGGPDASGGEPKAPSPG